jgi:cytochrome oxidase assembly protein ShyY1
MARPHSTFRTLAALVLLGAMIAAFVSLGNWQLRRAAERKSIMHAMQVGRASTPLHLNAGAPPARLLDWHPATATGTWLNDLTVLLQNRNFKGRAGYWVATPLLIDPGARSAVLVLRGWLPRPVTPGSALPAITAPAGTQTIAGEMTGHVPQLFELWSFSKQSSDQLPGKLPVPGQILPQVQNLDLAAYARATGLKLLPVVLEQTSDSADQWVRQWPGPSIDSTQNTGYALQWFSFAAIAAIAWLVVAGRAWRRRKQAASGSAPSARS